MARALGRYELLRPLARGGMAEVYLARRRSAGVEKWLVVKRMRPERSGDPRFLDLFVREARLSMSLVHQNIVPVFDFGKIDDQVFLAMERVEGKDLGSSLARARGQRLPPVLAAFIAAECCQALGYAHQRKSPDGVALGIVHRDVTPRNVLLSWSGEVKLTDFGIAALAGDATSRLLGTPQYMAPEQARGEPIDPRADIYAVGLVLREAVTGIRPRPGTDRESILDAARRGELVPWPHAAVPAPDPVAPAPGSGSGDRPPGLSPGPSQTGIPPADLVAIIDCATAVHPGDRYPDVRAMLEELDSFIVGQRAAHKGESPARQLAAWLAGIWEGVRDEIEADPAIDAEQLLSFIDDGAFDVVGTGTVRSMAATAADDAPVAAPDASAPGASAPGASAPGASAPGATAPPSVPAAMPPLAAMAAAASSTRSAEPGKRPGKISSSSATVASGSFHTLPASDAHAAVDGAPGAPSRRRTSRRAAPFASLLFVSAAIGAAVVFFFAAHRGEPGQSSTEPANGSDPTMRGSAGQIDAGQANAGQANAGQANAGQASAGQPDAGHVDAGQANAGQPDAGQADADQADARKPHTGQPGVGHPHTRQPHTSRVGSEESDPGARHEGSGGAPMPPMPGEGSNRASPAMCRVRINLTPWAYYAAEDGIRHETPSTIELTPGPHRIHVWNPELHVERDITISVPADRDTMNYSEPLQSTTLAPGAGTSIQP